MLREPTYFVLAALLERPLHGYAILKRVTELSRGRVTLSTGTLYGALERLEAQGLVAAGDDEVIGGRTRRTYTITDAGGATVTAEADRLAQAARVVRTAQARALRGRLA